jgi:putative MFS transporter
MTVSTQAQPHAGDASPAAALSVGLINARLERLPYTSWHRRARLVVGTATFFDAFDVLALSASLTVLIGLWHLTPPQIGILISTGFAGQFVGAIIFGWLAERIGRVPALNWTIAIYSVMSIACAFAGSYNALFVIRIIQGIGLGGEVPIAASYINEISRARGRGRFFLIYEVVFGFGLIGATLVGIWAVPHLGWQSMFVIGAVPAALTLVMRRLLPESPRWLAAQGRLAEADRVVSQIEASAVREGHQLGAVDPAAVVSPKPVRRHVTELFRGRYRRRTLVVWAIWFCTYFVSYGITTWMPALYRAVFHLDVQTALIYALGTSVAGLIGDFFCAFTIDRLGRRGWFGLAFLLGSLPLFAVWYLGGTSPLQLLLLASLSYFFMGANSIAAYLYTPETYPTRLRTLGTSIATAWLRAASVIGPTAVGFMLAGQGIGGVFGMFAVVALVGAVVAGLFAVETSGKSLEEISP